MKLDISKLPVGEAIVGFLILALIVTFVLAFSQTDEPEDEQVAAPTESPGETGDGDGTPAPGGDSIDVVMDDNFFDPEETSVAAGASVTFNLTNEGNIAHNMHIAGEDGDYGQPFCDQGGDDPCSDPNNIRGGQSGTLAWDVPDAPGEEVPFRCDFHPEEMTGTITIQ